MNSNNKNETVLLIVCISPSYAKKNNDNVAIKTGQVFAYLTYLYGKNVNDDSISVNVRMKP